MCFLFQGYVPPVPRPLLAGDPQRVDLADFDGGRLEVNHDKASHLGPGVLHHAEMSLTPHSCIQ